MQCWRRKRRVTLYAIEFFGDEPVNLLEFNDIALTYELKGAGERVVLVHASPFVSWYTPLIERLTGFSTLLYRRDLRKTDAGTYRRLTVAEDAAICVRLMAHVGWERAHVVGHSYGALVALQMVTSTAERVGTLSLLEPAIRGIPSSAAVLRALVPVVTTYKLGDTAGAVDAFLRLVCGDRYRAVLDRMIPNAFSEALAYADLFFQTEMPAIAEWSFGPADAARVTRPVLNVLGAESAQRFVEGSELLQSWFPKAEQLSVPAAGHLLMVQNPTAVADGLMGYFARHPIGNAG